MKSFIAALVLFYFGAFAFAQTDQKTSSGTKTQASVGTHRQALDVANIKHNFRPKITLQHALTLAEKFIETEKINISPYYLSEAKFIMFGSDYDKKNTKVPAWFFHWDNEFGSMGDYVNIVVLIDTGRVLRRPTL